MDPMGYEMENKSHVPVTTDVRYFQQALESLDHGDLGIPHFRKLPFVAVETEEHHQTSKKQGMIGVVKTWNPGPAGPRCENHTFPKNSPNVEIHRDWPVSVSKKKTSESMGSIGPSSNLQSFSRSPGLLDRKSLGDGSKALGLPETRGQVSTLQGPRAAPLPGSGWIHGQRSRSLRCLATARAPSSGWTRHQRWDFPDLGVAGRQQKIVPTGFNGQIDIPANPSDHPASEVSPKAGWSNSQKSSSSRILARTRASAPIWNCCSRNSGALGQHKNHSDSRWSFHGCKI